MRVPRPTSTLYPPHTLWHPAHPHRLLIPYMADRINTTSSNSTFVLQQYASDKVCRTAVQNCNGTNLQYDNYDDCMSFLAAKPIGEWYR